MAAMNDRWTSSRVAALPPRSGPYTDPGQVGLQLLVRDKANSKPSRTWLLRFKWRGEESRIVLGHFPETSLDTARGLARKYREMSSQGIDPRKATSRRQLSRPSNSAETAATLAAITDHHSVEFLAAEFMELYVKKTRKRPEYVQRMLNLDVLNAWRNRDARTIKPREVIELLDGIVERGSPVQANRTAAVVGQMFKWGIHRGIVDSTPVQLLMRPGGKEKPKERALSAEELKALINNIDELTKTSKLAHVIMILLMTGQRRGELALSRWRDIDFDKATWTIPAENSKTGKGHVVPLSPWVCEEFKKLQRLARRSIWVLPDQTGSAPANAKLLTRGLARCLQRFKAVDIEPFTLHDLRRTCRTGLSKLKIEPHIAERVLNHAQEKIAGTYDVYQYIDEKREALNKWADHLQTLRP